MTPTFPTEHDGWATSAPPPKAPRTERQDSLALCCEQRLLLVEDSALLRDRLIEMLTLPGVVHVAAAVDTEAAAIGQVETDRFDVLIIDVELREGSGINVIREARELYGEGEQPLIIVLTNYSLQAVRDRCIAAGADYFLDKMSQFGELRQLIEARGRGRQH
jgi:two-component system, OmpR family, response regulator